MTKHNIFTRKLIKLKNEQTFKMSNFPNFVKMFITTYFIIVRLAEFYFYGLREKDDDEYNIKTHHFPHNYFTIYIYINNIYNKSTILFL